MVFSLVVVLVAGLPSAQDTLRAVDRQEALNDELEAHFDSLCAALKAGRRTLSPTFAVEGVGFPLDGVVHIPSCSVRALAIGAAVNGEFPLRLLWDIDGRDAQSRRVSVRSESDAAIKRTPRGWVLTRIDITHPRRLERDQPRFVERAAQAGLVLPQRAGEPTSAEYLSTTLTVRDVDGDGVPDALVLDGPVLYLFRGQAGLRFAAPTVVARAPRGKTLTGAALGDLDGDGDPDLVVTTYRDQPLRVFRNDHGTLVEGPSLGRGGQHQSAVLSDLNGDGTLDVVALSYPMEYAIPSSFFHSDNGEAPEFWLGQGDLTFRRLTPPPGVAQPHWSYGGMAADLVCTGGMQLYVVNDFGVKDLYVVQADGGVAERAAAFGLDDPGTGMSVDFGDIDNDGQVDLYVANMFSKAGTRIANTTERLAPEKREQIAKFARGNTLFVAQRDGGYVDQAQALGVERGLWAFGSLMADVDNDSRLEVLVANGYISGKRRKDL
jgi:FG-GAP-like repeat